MGGTAPMWLKVGIIALVVIAVIVFLIWCLGAAKHDNEERPADEEDAL